MRAPYYVDAAATTPYVNIGLLWEADAIFIDNPTQYTALVRVGSGSKPVAITDADFFCAPASMLQLPVAAREFCVVLAQPSLSAPPEGMPTRCTVLLTRNEAAVAIGSVPIVGLTPPAAVVLSVGPTGQPVGLYADTVPLPVGIRSLALRGVGDRYGYITVQGNTSGLIYMSMVAPTGYSHNGNALVPSVVALVDRELDAVVTVGYTVTSVGLNGYTLVGYRDRLTPQSSQVDGRQMVDILPPSQRANPVMFTPTAPDYDVYGVAIAPAAFAVVCATPAMVAGDYRVEAELASTDLAGVSKYIELYHNPGAKRQVFAPSPLPLSVVWSRVTVTAGDNMVIATGGAGGAGSTYGGSIRAYRLS
jgi:hypothetical protein